MKKLSSIALAIGFLVSTALIGLEPLTDYALLSWEMPGITAAYLFWGAAGDSVLLGTAIAWLVNAAVYGVAAFVILGACVALKHMIAGRRLV